MDIALKKRKTRHIKLYIVLALAAVPVAFAIQYLWFLGQSDFSVPRDTLVLGQVQSGDFVVSVRGTGILAPDNVHWLSAEVEATVTRVVARGGNVVSTGDLIVELSNPQLVQQLGEARWELEAQEAEADAIRVTQEMALLEQKAGVLNAQMNYESSLLRQQAESQLVSTGAVSRLDYERTVLETTQFQQRWQISQEQYDQMEANAVAQHRARMARLSKTRNIMESIQAQVDGLEVRATMDSVVLEMPLEPGQRISMGTNIAKLAEQDSLIAELRVPEIQIRDVAVGQRVLVDTRNNKIEGTVVRVDPAVVNGNVQVDVVFTEKLPDDARPDLSVDGEIRVAEIEQTLYVDRPLFAQSRSDSFFYKVTRNGQFAERVPVRVGYGSVNQIQIIDGLQAGDIIVTSNPTRFERHENFRIN